MQIKIIDLQCNSAVEENLLTFGCHVSIYVYLPIDLKILYIQFDCQICTMFRSTDQYLCEQPFSLKEREFRKNSN